MGVSPIRGVSRLRPGDNIHMPTIARLSIAPLKSGALGHPSSIRLGPGGVDGDRQFVLIDDTGRRISATKLAYLLPVEPSFDEDSEHLSLRFADGSILAGSTQPRGGSLTISLWDVEPTATLIDPVFDEGLSERLRMEVRLVRVLHPSPGPRDVTLMAAATITDLAQRMAVAPERLDPDRFRMTVILDDSPCWLEDEWEGKRVRVGEALVEVNRSVTRCLVTCWNPSTGQQDLDTLTTLSSYRQLPDGKLALGRYAQVLEAGAASVGDMVELA